MKFKDKILLLIGLIIVIASVNYELNREVIQFEKGWFSIITGVLFVLYPITKYYIRRKN